MTLEQYWRAVIKRWKLILLCLMLVGLGTYIGSRLMTPLYQATALVEITLRTDTNQTDINTSEQLVQTEAKLAISDRVLGEVASHYPGLTTEQLAREVTIVPTPNTQLFEIEVLDASPTRAAALANEIAATLITQQIQQAQQENIQSQQQIQLDLQQTQQQIGTISGQITALRAQKGNEAQISLLEAQLNALQQHYSQGQLLLAQLQLAEAHSGKRRYLV